jgi:DNA-binding NtrC family response regulator
MGAPIILVADDESGVRGYIRWILAGHEYQLMEAADGLDALEQMKGHSGALDLLIADVRMPRMDGTTLAQALIGKYPGVSVLFTSGYAFDLESEKKEHAYAVCSFLLKPFTAEALLKAVRHCLEGTRLAGGALAS